MSAKELANRDVETLTEAIAKWLRTDPCARYLAEQSHAGAKLKRAMALGFAVSKGNRQVAFSFEEDPVDLAEIGSRMMESFAVADEFSREGGELVSVSSEQGSRLRVHARFDSKFIPAFSTAPTYYHLDVAGRIELEGASAVEGFYIFPTPGDPMELRIVACAERGSRTWRPSATPHLEMFSEDVAAFKVRIPAGGTTFKVRGTIATAVFETVKAGHISRAWRSGANPLAVILSGLLAMN